MSNSNINNNSSSSSNKRLKIINEEKYVDSLNKIIQRDFFPDLPNLKNQLEWLDAVESNDMDKMKSVQLASLRRATTGRRNFNGETPIINGGNNSSSNTFETPINSNSFETPIIHNNSNSGSNSIINNSSGIGTTNNDSIENTNLDSFVNTYTSEDDASYIGIQEKQNERILIKYKWLFDKANEYNRKNQLQRLEGGVDNNNSGNIKTTSTSIIEYNTPKCKIPSTSDYKVKNHLMFKPSTLDQSLLSSREIIGGPPKEIQYNNTRITGKIWNDQDTNPTTTTMRGSNAKEKPFSEMTLSEQIEKLKQMESEGRSTMEIESSMLGYLSTPQIIPGRGGDESPLMTWGRVDGTPLLLGSQPISTPLDLKYKGSTSFKIPETPKREQLANKLYEKVSGSVTKTTSLNSPKRRHNTGGSTPTLKGLSPAAQRYLLKGGSGNQTPINIKSPHHIDDQLRKSYSSPTPKPKHFSASNLTPTPKPISTPKSTPKLINTTYNNTTTPLDKTTTTTTTSSITDNLLDFT